VIPSTAILAGVDTGGTFTDVVVLSGGRLRHCKVLSTPEDPSIAIHEGLDRLGVAEKVRHVIHGTTVGTNAVLEGKGARVAYVTSKGFGDVLSLGRQNRKAVYDLCQAEQPPPVAPELCLEVTTRISADGDILAAATEEELASLRAQLEALQTEAVAVNLLFSFLRPGEEQRIAAALGSRWFLSLSSEVLPEIREYERGIATWLNAAVGPVISRYLKELSERLPQAGISVMQSSGTTIAADQASRQAVRLLLSGPAGGLAAARLAGRMTGQDRLLSFDMGGTSTDVALLDGDIPLSNDCRVGDWPLGIAAVDIHTIGAGGGSIARVDAGGLLMVGPESAGAEPGPACYDRGGEQATVTDANLVLGRIPADALLGGYLPLVKERADAAMDRLARAMGCSRIEAARGVICLANEHMVRALRVISVERGHDPRAYTLFSFGGAGGLHACELAGLMDISSIILPARAGVLSAEGMLASEPGRDLSMAMLASLDGTGDATIQRHCAALQSIATEQLAAEGVAADQVTCRRQLELRYRGQNATFVLDFTPGDDHAEAFHCAHELASGHRLDQAIELVNLRVSARAVAPVQTTEPLSPAASGPQARSMYMADLQCVVPVLDRDQLPPGFAMEGPAIIAEKVATSWLAPGWSMRVDEWGHLRLDLAQPRQQPA
jgi:N-methylhydantoinase A